MHNSCISGNQPRSRIFPFSRFGMRWIALWIIGEFYAPVTQLGWPISGSRDSDYRYFKFKAVKKTWKRGILEMGSRTLQVLDRGHVPMFEDKAAQIWRRWRLGWISINLNIKIIQCAFLQELLLSRAHNDNVCPCLATCHVDKRGKIITIHVMHFLLNVEYGPVEQMGKKKKNIYIYPRIAPKRR